MTAIKVDKNDTATLGKILKQELNTLGGDRVPQEKIFTEEMHNVSIVSAIVKFGLDVMLAEYRYMAVCKIFALPLTPTFHGDVQQSYDVCAASIKSLAKEMDQPWQNEMHNMSLSYQMEAYEDVMAILLPYLPETKK